MSLERPLFFLDDDDVAGFPLSISADAEHVPRAW